METVTPGPVGKCLAQGAVARHGLAETGAQVSDSPLCSLLHTARAQGRDTRRAAMEIQGSTKLLLHTRLYARPSVTPLLQFSCHPATWACTLTKSCLEMSNDSPYLVPLLLGSNLVFLNMYPSTIFFSKFPGMLVKNVNPGLCPRPWSQNFWRWDPRRNI